LKLSSTKSFPFKRMTCLHCGNHLACSTQGLSLGSQPLKPPSQWKHFTSSLTPVKKEKTNKNSNLIVVFFSTQYGFNLYLLRSRKTPTHRNDRTLNIFLPVMRRLVTCNRQPRLLAGDLPATGDQKILRSPVTTRSPALKIQKVKNLHRNCFSKKIWKFDQNVFFYKKRKNCSSSSTWGALCKKFET